MGFIKTHLMNKVIINFSIEENNSCSIVLNHNYNISFETLGRFIGKNNEFICTQDHGHKFGLTEPFNATQSISEFIIGKTIIDVEIEPISNDLILKFETGVFEIICSSSGYESYQINGPNNLLIVGTGGQQ